MLLKACVLLPLIGGLPALADGVHARAEAAASSASSVPTTATTVPPAGGPPNYQSSSGSVQRPLLPDWLSKSSVAAFPDVASSLPSAAQELVSLRTRDEKVFHRPDGKYVAVFGHNLHYEAAPGQWEDVNLDFRAAGADQVVDRNEVVVRVTGDGVSVTDRRTGDGVLWRTPARPEVAGRIARFSRDGLDWRYETEPNGVKLTAPVSAARGPHTYQFAYDLQGAPANDLVVTDWGDLLGSGFTVPRAVVVGANQIRYATPRWRVLPDRTVAFDFDDSALPPDAFPYVIDPTTTFGATDGGIVVGDGPTYPPSSWQWAWGVSGAGWTSVGKDRFASGSGSNSRTHCYSGSTPCFSVSTGMLRWNTSSLPDDATILSAYTSGYVGPVDNADNPQLLYELPGPWAPVGPEDWTPDPRPAPPYGSFYLSNLTSNSVNAIGILNLAGISKSGYSELKLHLYSSGAPTGSNGFSYGGSGSPSVALVVEYQYCGLDSQAPYTACVLADNPVSYWPLDDAAGDPWAHDRRDRNHGAIQGGVTAAQASDVSGTAMRFDGSSGHIRLFGASGLQPQSVSVEAWFKTSASPPTAVLFRSRWYGYSLQLEGGSLVGNVYGASPAPYRVTGPFVADDRWHQAVLSKDGSTITLYLDANQVATAVDAESINYSGTGIAIGEDGDCVIDPTYGPTNCGYFSGLIDEVAVYDHALAPDRVAAHFNASATPMVSTSGSTAPTGVGTPLSVGPHHSMAIKADGSVYAWGQNAHGELGNGTTANSPGGVAVSGLESVVSVAAGDSFSLALKSDGTVWSWGRDDLGQLGDGWTNDSEDAQWVTTPVPGLALDGMVKIAAGCTHALALGADGNVWAWGDNTWGQLGVDGGGVSPVRVHVPRLTGITAVAAGCGWSMALTSWGQVLTWGANYSGQLGDGTTTSRFAPAPVPNLAGVTAIGAGQDHAMAVVAGAVKAWGGNGSGQLGNGSSGGVATTPQSVVNLTGVTAVVGGRAHSVALASGGQVWAWGDNASSQLGNNSTAPSSVPVQMRIDGLGTPFTGVVAIGAGGNTSSGIVAGRVRQAGNHYDGTTCLNAMDQPGPAPTTGVNPIPRPPAHPPSPKCAGQSPTPEAQYGPLDNNKRATSATRTLNSAILRPSAGRPQVDFDPVGFPSPNPPRPDQWDRSHLLAYIFGGTTTRAEQADTTKANIVALHFQANRNPAGMQRYEAEIQSHLVEPNCATITFTATANYSPGTCTDVHDTSCAPTGVKIHAEGDDGYYLDWIITNSKTPAIAPGH